MFYFAIGLTIASNIIYHIAQKSVPQNANPIVSVIVTYLVALATSLAIMPLFSNKDSLTESVKVLNWAPIAIGVAIVGVEIGFLLAYRAGWNISLGAVTSNVAVTLLLIPIGVLFFKETISLTHVGGIAMCVGGLWLIFK